MSENDQICFNDFVKNLNLESIYLKNINANFSDNNNAFELTLELKEDHSFSISDNTLTIIQYYELIGKSVEHEVISISGSYVLKYHIGDSCKYNDENINRFIQQSVSLTIWPYFRELVNSSVSKMGLPPLIIPLVKR